MKLVVHSYLPYLPQAFKNVSNSLSNAIAQARGQHDPYAVPVSHTVPSTAFGDLEEYLKAQAPLLSTLYTQSGALALRSREQVRNVTRIALLLQKTPIFPILTEAISSSF